MTDHIYKLDEAYRPMADYAGMHWDLNRAKELVPTRVHWERSRSPNYLKALLNSHSNSIIRLLDIIEHYEKTTQPKRDKA